ncbi:hypothetical protein BDZ94DRAFT_1174637 [Collybia nuda]|uniref:SHSP domain-containing protein n=1 Tax=Collybia nuda TaxID=64659 RepID=A0A9P5XUD8_9AGAR|nr:hypothetical protein BDZ94DRAFT_1174637 [Collybia nuda]
MSYSPPIRRLSTTSSSSKEDLINAYEAEEERIINILSRKLEQLREEKISLENTREAESESQVNRMARELTALRMAQQQQYGGTSNSSVSASPEIGMGFRSFMTSANPGEPSAETMLEAMRRENEQLRNRLVDTERDYIRVTRLNEVYREELIEHRSRLGISVDNLIGLSSTDPYSQPTHLRSASSSHSNTSSPSTSIMHFPTHASRPIHGVPIPRPPSQIHRPSQTLEGNTPLSHSPSSSESPFPFSPITNPTSLISPNTNTTSPPSSFSFNSTVGVSYAAPSRGLSYPSVPPPSLSSSFGSPTVSYHMPHREHSLSPVEPLSRRNSNARRGTDWRVAETGSLRGINDTSRRGSVDRGARVAETGTLLPRSRAGSQSVTATDSAEVNGVTNAIKTASAIFAMSYSYGQFPGEQYSNPSTPLDVFPQWETVEREEQQSQQQQAQQQQQQSQQQQIPQHQHELHSPTAPLQPPQPQFQIIQLDEPQHVVPSQRGPAHDDTPIRLHHVNKIERRRDHRESESHNLRVDTAARPGTASGSGPSMAMRSARPQAHNQSHPYRRPPSAAGTSSAMQRPREQQVRFASGGSSSMPSPAIPSPAMPLSAMASPASRLASFGSAMSLPRVAPRVTPTQRPYIIRTDTNYDPETRLLTVLLELPGVKKTDLRVTLSTCQYNGVRQIIVSGQTAPTFPIPPAGGEDNNVRERKFGKFSRTIPVPSDIKREDIDACLEDGILTLKIPCGIPVDRDEQDISVR